MKEHQTLLFVIGVLYCLDDKWKGSGNSSSFDDIVSNRCGVSLHRAFNKLDQEGLLEGIWDDFDYDHLYGHSESLAIALSRAVITYGLIKIGGTDLCYHLDLEPEEILRMLHRQDISVNKVREVAHRLNELLDEQAQERSVTKT